MLVTYVQPFLVGSGVIIIISLGIVSTAPPEAAETLNRDHEIDIAGTEMLELPPLPEKVIVNPRVPAESITKPPSLDLLPPTSVTSFSVASLQQYTGSFREENVISDGRFGKTYLAELPDRKV